MSGEKSNEASKVIKWVCKLTDTL